MPSIRRSLIGYFLLLLGLALGGVSLIVDRIAREALLAREDAERRRMQQEYALRCSETETKFNEELYRDGELLGRDLADNNRELMNQEHRNLQSMIWSATIAELVTGDFWGTSVTQAVALLEMVPPQRRFSPLLFSYMLTIQSDEALSRTFADDEKRPKYFQFNLPRSRRVIIAPAQTIVLPFDSEQFQNISNRDYLADDVTIPGIGTLRRVVMKTFAVRDLPFDTPRLQEGHPALAGGVSVYMLNHLRPTPVIGSVSGGIVLALRATNFRSSRPSTPSPSRRRVDVFPSVYIQCARPKADLDILLFQHTRKLTDDLTNLSLETRQGVAWLRARLVAIATLTFVALALGGWWLVGRGLSPVRKLSEAVSRVNEKDFRVPVEASELSHELLPILDRLTHALNALRRAFEREKQSVADISHELRTPLAGLLATLDVSLRKPRSAEQYRVTLLECRDIGKQLSHLVERILTLARMDAGHIRHTIQRVDPADILQSCVGMVRSLIDAHGQTLTTDFTSGLSLKTDPDMLREVVMNLLSNAVEYNSSGGTIHLSLSQRGTNIIIEVRDTGIGMDPAVTDKIFERFYRVDQSRHETGVHAGLGLSIVKEYLDRLGGTIGVSSALNQGSTFTITLPAEPQKSRLLAEEPVSV